MFTDEQIAFLNECRTGHLATVDPRGRPHNVPVCFAVRNDRIYIAIDEKPKQAAPGDLRRVRNLLANPAVCLVVDRYDEDWARLAWLQVRGQAMLTEDADERAGAFDALRNRYPQYRAMTLEDRPLIRIVADRIVAWQAATHSASNRPRV